MSQKSQSANNTGKNPAQDTLFETTTNQAFEFNDQVVRVFPDMINRSVPGYSLIIPMLGLLARRFVQADSKVYDLGCSLGAASLAIRDALSIDNVEMIAVDNSTAMVEKFKLTLAQNPGKIPLRVELKNIEACRTVDASLVVLNFTLQFIDPEKRLALLENIHRELKPGGALLLSEKICFEDKHSQVLQTDWHHDFKRTQGYSDMEIANKRTALENVLVPETLAVQQARLREAGFEKSMLWFQCFNFVSLVAIKS